MIDDSKFAAAQAALDAATGRPPAAQVAPGSGGRLNLEAMSQEELYDLRDRINLRLPRASLDSLNLEQELVDQYRRVLLLQEHVLLDDDIPANQRAQCAGQVAGTLQHLIKMQTEYHTAERFKAIEQLMVKALRSLPAAAAAEFIAEYERMYGALAP